MNLLRTCLKKNNDKNMCSFNFKKVLWFLYLGYLLELWLTGHIRCYPVMYWTGGGGQEHIVEEAGKLWRLFRAVPATRHNPALCAWIWQQGRREGLGPAGTRIKIDCAHVWVYAHSAATSFTLSIFSKQIRTIDTATNPISDKRYNWRQTS